MLKMEIRLLNNEEIDKKAWDQSLKRSPGFELYLRSAYLDIVFPKWKALVAGDYRAIFPIFEKKIIFWKFLRQPLFTGPCLVVGQDDLSTKKLLDYLPELLKKYHWLELNILNDLPELEKYFKKQNRKLQILKIPEEGFIPDGRLKKNLKRAEKSKIINLVSLNTDEFIKGVKEHLLSAHKALNPSGLRKLHKIISHKDEFGGKCIGIKNEMHSFQAAQFFLKGESKLYIILSLSSEEGRKNSALHALQVKLIDTFLPTKGSLHFGGSNLERVAEYNYNYGAEDVSYMLVTRKKFPFIFFNF